MSDYVRCLVTVTLLACSAADKEPTLPAWEGVGEESDTGEAAEGAGADDTADTGETSIAPCWDESLGSATGTPVVRGDTTGATHDWASDFDGHCGATAGPDVAYLWRAPETGCYRFDTNGSFTDYDVMLSLFDPGVHGVCDGDGVTGGIVCSDDEGDALNASLDHTLDKDSPVLVIVDGYNDEIFGEFELNIQTCDEAESPNP